jgi:succinyl-CoA synthetase alpha subunit
MNGVAINEVRRGFYLDSVALMRLSRRIAAMDGVEEAALMMGTSSNKRIMADAGLLAASGEAAEGGDLVIGVRAETEAAGREALGLALRELDTPMGHGGAASAWRARTIRAAVKSAPGSNLALISVPGDFAAAEARKALRAGLHVMMFSDNVSLKDEVALKREARDKGLLLMGPDCGTAIINGVPLAFANVVPRGDIGLIGASGTGTQEISCLIAQGGRGVSHAIGVGGRDLTEEVGGIMTLMALDALDADSATKHVVLVSKPPSPVVASRILERMGASKKTFTACFVGAEGYDLPANTGLATTLKAGAEHALGGTRIGGGFDAAALAVPLPKGRDQVRGLFAGGTLCAEAQVIFRAAGKKVASNGPIPGAMLLTKDGAGHRMIDLGADDFTRGRPHPMIDPSVRDAALAEAFRAPSVGIVLLDVVIGYGAHADPARHLADFLAANRRIDCPRVIASVTGTDGDPQGRAGQIATLEAAGVRVAPSNADAASLALACLGEVPGGG